MFAVKSYHSIILSFLPLIVSPGILSISNQVSICVHVHVSVCILLIVTNSNNTEIHKGRVNSTFHRKPLIVCLGFTILEFKRLIHTRVYMTICVWGQFIHLGFQSNWNLL